MTEWWRRSRSSCSARRPWSRGAACMSGVSVQIDSLSRRLGGRDVLRGLTLEVEPGDWLALLGPSGAGKTTLLRSIAGLEKPDGGRILFEGRDQAGVAPRDRKVGFVFQDLGLWPYL